MSVNNIPNTPPISTPGKLLTIESIAQFLTNLVNSVVSAFTSSNIAINGLIADDNTNTTAIAANTTAIALLNSQANSKIISFTRVMTTAAGNVSYTGVGFKPSAVIFIAGIVGGSDSGSTGFSSASTNASLETLDFGTFGVFMQSVSLIIRNPTLADFQTATIASMDTDGFTLTWAKSGSPTGTGTVFALCLR